MTNEETTEAQARALVAQAEAMERMAKVIVGLVDKIEANAVYSMTEEQRIAQGRAKAQQREIEKTLGIGKPPIPRSEG